MGISIYDNLNSSQNAICGALSVSVCARRHMEILRRAESLDAQWTANLNNKKKNEQQQKSVKKARVSTLDLLLQKIMLWAAAVVDDAVLIPYSKKWRAYWICHFVWNTSNYKF